MNNFRIWFLGFACLVGSPGLLSAQPPAPALPPGVKLLRDLAYVPHGHERQKLDLYLPTKAAGPLPVVVWIHGGAWLEGSKDFCPAVPFTTHGYAVASINYRLSQHAHFPAQIQDCKAAIRWLRAHSKQYHLDPDHIGVWGASAGGHLVALLGTSAGAKDLGGNDHGSSRVQAVVDWFGPTDFTQMGGWHARPDSPEARLLGGPVAEKKALAARANPITFVSKDSAPFLIMHGDQDNTVPIGQSQLLAEALVKAGAEVNFIPVRGAGHGGPAFTQRSYRVLVFEFFERHLKPASSTALPRARSGS